MPWNYYHELSEIGLKKTAYFQVLLLGSSFFREDVFLLDPDPDKLDWTCLTFVPFPNFSPVCFANVLGSSGFR